MIHDHSMPILSQFFKASYSVSITLKCCCMY